MIQSFARNLAALRKKREMTQEELARQLNVSFQAVSKWENAQSSPDIAFLPELAQILETDIDFLLGYLPQKKQITAYEQRYQKEGYYWGIEPQPMCYEVLRLRPPVRPLRLLDVGCGEGKDAVFFAKNGYVVSAFDIAEAGIEKAKKLAAAHGVQVNFFTADLKGFRLVNDFDIIYSSGVLHYIEPELRMELLGNYQEHTSNGGLAALNVFVNKPFIPPAPDEELPDLTWKSGELFTCYANWHFHQCEELVFDCGSGGVAHKHCMDMLLAEKRDQ